MKIISDKEWQEELTRNIEQGYIQADGTPIKCTNCESKNIGMKNEMYISYGLCEYEKYCRDCGQLLGYWAYGHWQI
jgi:hypothetical protein